MLLGLDSGLAGGFLAEMQEQADLVAGFRERAVGIEGNIGRGFRWQIISYHDILSCATATKSHVRWQNCVIHLCIYGWFLSGMKEKTASTGESTAFHSTWRFGSSQIPTPCP